VSCSYASVLPDTVFTRSSLKLLHVLIIISANYRNCRLCNVFVSVRMFHAPKILYTRDLMSLTLFPRKSCKGKTYEIKLSKNVIWKGGTHNIKVGWHVGYLESNFKRVWLYTVNHWNKLLTIANYQFVRAVLIFHHSSGYMTIGVGTGCTACAQTHHTA